MAESADSCFDIALSGKLVPEKARDSLISGLELEAEEAVDARHATALILLSKALKKVEPAKLFTPAVDEVLPNGWRYGSRSWMRFRYAWREGLAEALGLKPDDEIVSAIDDLTRMRAAEIDPTEIPKEPSSGGGLTPILALAGLALSVVGISVTLENTRETKKSTKLFKSAKKIKK